MLNGEYSTLTTDFILFIYFFKLSLGLAQIPWFL